VPALERDVDDVATEELCASEDEDAHTLSL